MDFSYCQPRQYSLGWRTEGTRLIEDMTAALKRQQWPPITWVLGIGFLLLLFTHFCFYHWYIKAGLLFAVVGRMVYDRTHTRDFNDLETLQLGRKLPFAAITFVIAGVASMGLPGFSGFIAGLRQHSRH